VGKGNRNYEVNFKQDENLCQQLLKGGGTIVETETYIPLSASLANARSYVIDHYNDATIKKLQKLKK
jgi:hypothetical protein